MKRTPQQLQRIAHLGGWQDAWSSSFHFQTALYQVYSTSIVLECTARIFPCDAGKPFCDKAWQRYAAVSMPAVPWHSNALHGNSMACHDTAHRRGCHGTCHVIGVIWDGKCHGTCHGYNDDTRRGSAMADSKPRGMPCQPVACYGSLWQVSRAVMVTHGSPWSLPWYATKKQYNTRIYVPTPDPTPVAGGEPFAPPHQRETGRAPRWLYTGYTIPGLCFQTSCSCLAPRLQTGLVPPGPEASKQTRYI